MQVFNVDKTGINVTQHKRKVVSEVKRRNVHRVVAMRNGKNHTIIACGSASGFEYQNPLKLMLHLEVF